jgi:hypothetical protein
LASRLRQDVGGEGRDDLGGQEASRHRAEESFSIGDGKFFQNQPGLYGVPGLSKKGGINAAPQMKRIIIILIGKRCKFWGCPRVVICAENEDAITNNPHVISFLRVGGI